MRCVRPIDATDRSTGSTDRLDRSIDWIDRSTGSIDRCDRSIDWIDRSTGSIDRLDRSIDWIDRSTGSTDRLDRPDPRGRAFSCDVVVIHPSFIRPGDAAGRADARVARTGDHAARATTTTTTTTTTTHGVDRVDRSLLNARSFVRSFVREELGFDRQSIRIGIAPPVEFNVRVERRRRTRRTTRPTRPRADGGR